MRIGRPAPFARLPALAACDGNRPQAGTPAMTDDALADAKAQHAQRDCEAGARNYAITQLRKATS